jgi:hypothetical protein
MRQNSNSARGLTSSGRVELPRDFLAVERNSYRICALTARGATTIHP